MIVVVKSKLVTTRFRYCEPIFYATIENSFSLMCERNVGFLISGKQSNSINRRVKENTAGEVRVAPLSERRLLLEILFYGREVLLLENIVVALICCTEVLVVERAVAIRVLRRIPHLPDILGSNVLGLDAATWNGRAALLEGRKAA